MNHASKTKQYACVLYKSVQSVYNLHRQCISPHKIRERYKGNVGITMTSVWWLMQRKVLNLDCHTAAVTQ